MNTREALQEIYDEHGQLTPALVVATAADPEHVLHGRFVWDDTEAARLYRLVQAATIIRSVHVRLEKAPKKTVSVRAFVSDRDLVGSVEPDDEVPAPSGRYRPVREVVESDVLRTAWFQALARDWQALRRRAGDSQEFADMVLHDLGGTITP